MFYWFLLALLPAAGFTDDIIVLPVEIELALVNAPDVIKVEASSGLYLPTESIKVQLTVHNPTEEAIMVDVDDTPFESILLNGMIPSDYISRSSDAIWTGVDSEFVASLADPSDHIKLICKFLEPGSTLTATMTLGGEMNPIGFTKANGKAKISFDVEMKECDENGEYSGTEIKVTTNSIEVLLEGEEQVGNNSPSDPTVDQWLNRGYVETDENGVFYWVSTHDDPGRTWTHPAQPRTYTFAPDSGCSESLTHNGVTKTLEEWITHLEADKHQLCASAVYHMQERTDTFYKQYEELFGDFTEDGFEDLKGKVARMCSADGYEYNCNGKRQCNTGLIYRHCWSIKKSKYPLECTDVTFEGKTLEKVEMILEDNIIDLPQHQGETMESLRQDMLQCSLDPRDCKEGSVPTTVGGVVAYVDYFDDREGGKRTINLCPYMFWMGFRRFWCDIAEIQDQYDPDHVYAWDLANQCFVSPSIILFHELGHFADIANGDHSEERDEGLSSTTILSRFMIGVAKKPSPPPSPAPTVDPDATSAPIKPYVPRKTCGDGSMCARYGRTIASNPSYWCGLFGGDGMYCKYYPQYCCLEMCGECNISPPTQTPSAAPTNDMTKKGGIYTLWTIPEWMEVTWNNFPITSTSAEETSFSQLFQYEVFDFAAQHPTLSVLTIFGLFAIIYYIIVAVRKFLTSDSYMEISAPEI